VNASRWDFAPKEIKTGKAIRVPLRVVKDLTTATLERYRRACERGPFVSLRDFYERTSPGIGEVENLIRAGAFDGFGESRTTQFWQLRRLAQWPRSQGYLFQSSESALPTVPLTEPDQAQRLRDEMELLGFTVSGHPLDQFCDVAWQTYCPITDLKKYPRREVTVCGLIIQDRMFSQVTGDKMKFITVCDYTGFIECEIFAEAYRRFGINTVRYPVVEVTGRAIPFDNDLGCSLQVERVGKPRQKN